MSLTRKLWALALLALLPTPAFAAVDSGDTAWMLTSSALVLLMTPGLAFFYGGMVRGKNVITTLYQSLIAMGVVGVLWIVIGYSLAFSTGSEYIGDKSFVMFAGVGQEPNEGSTIPHLLFAIYQMMFAIITPALITGAFAERVRFKQWILFCGIWSLCVYAPIAHWVWTPGGWLAKQGALDFAGGFVVHMSAGFSALAAAMVIGKRRDFGAAAAPFSPGYVLLGTAMLWFGWFGFNGGSALASNGLAVQAFANSFAASAMAMLFWLITDNTKDGKPTLMGACIGVVAGLVAITPAAGFVTIETALTIGAITGVECNIVARIVKAKWGVDDSLDVFACHGVGGLIGVLATGLYATTSVNAAGAEGLMNGGEKLWMANVTGAIAVGAFSFLATWLILKVVGGVGPIRATDAEEQAGLDASEHGESIGH